MLWHRTDYGGWSTRESSREGRWKRSLDEDASGFNPSFWTSTFVRDISTMGIESGSISMHVEPKSARDLIEQSLPSSGRGLERAAGDFLCQFVSAAIQSEPVACEVVFAAPPGDAPKPATFNICWVPGFRQRLWMGGEQQVDSSWKRLSAERLVVFRMPWWDRWRLRKALAVLRAADRRDLGFRERYMLGYDYRVHRRKEAECIMRVTRFCGWNSDLLTQYMLEPHVIWRLLHMFAFRSRLRSYAVGALNEAMDIAGRILGFKATAKWRDNPDVVEETRRRLATGDCSELVDLVRSLYLSEDAE